MTTPLAFLTALITLAQAQAPESLTVPESIIADRLPPISSEISQQLERYQNIRSARFQGWLEPDPAERASGVARAPMLLLTRFGETTQAHRAAFPAAARTQLTFQPERVLAAKPRPQSRTQFAFQADEGGGENYQIFLVDTISSQPPKRLTDGLYRHESPVWSPSGRGLALSGNSRNGRDMDLYVLHLDDPAPPTPRLVAQVEGNWAVLDWSPDESQLLALEYISINQSSLHLVDLKTGAVKPLTPPLENGAKVAHGPIARFAPDGHSLYFTTDRDSEFLQLVRLDLGTGVRTTLTDSIAWDIEEFDLTDDARTLAVVANHDGLSHLHILDAATGTQQPEPQLPPGIISDLEFRSGSQELGFTLAGLREPDDAFSFDLDAWALARWTTSETGGLAADRFPAPETIRLPTFDNRQIPAFLYRPDPTRFPGKRPVIIDIHGGPEGQFRPSFLGRDAYLVTELGIALIFPNVRGSSGYGKTYLTLDNGLKRGDTVRDIGALLDWIALQPDLDPARVGVTGGSYGGFMSLAVQTDYNDRIRAGVDVVGISNFVTFLTNTKGYRRDLRRAEYGDERDPELRAYLESISPLAKAGRIKTPLLVVQGKNDPRVPISEADQIVAAVRAGGGPVWYIVGTNEGHGFARRANQDFQQAAEIAFWKQFLLNGD